MVKSKILLLIWFFNLIIFVAINAYGAKDKIILGGDYWCPFNCDDKAKDKGYLIEVAEKVFEIYGVDVEYKLMPWDVALEEAKKGNINGVVGTSEKEDGFIFPKSPIIYSRISAFTNIDNEWIFDGTSSLKCRIVTLIIDYDLGNNVREYILKNYPTDPSFFIFESGIYATNNCINNIITNKAEVYLEDESVVNDYLIKNKLTSKIKNAGILRQDPIPTFIGFSSMLDSSKTYIKMLEDGQKSLEATGDLKKLRIKYNIPAKDFDANF